MNSSICVLFKSRVVSRLPCMDDSYHPLRSRSSLGITRQRDRATFEEVDHQANAHILAAARRAGVSRFGFVSVARPELFRDCALVQARERFVAALLESDIEACVVRPTGFFNDMRDAFEMARKGRVFLIGDGNARINPIHGADLATVCVDALELRQSVSLAGGPDTFTWNQIAELAFRTLGTRTRVTHVPEWVVAAALPMVRLASRRAYDIASFVRRGLVNDVTAPERGHRHLSDFYQALARDAGSTEADA